MNVFFLVLYFLLAIMIQSCASIGSDFDFKGPQSIQLGQTTRNEIVRTYGVPFRSGFNNGELVWTYGLYKYRLWRASETKDLQIIFNKKGLVTDYSYSTSVNAEKEKLMLSTLEE